MDSDTRVDMILACGGSDEYFIPTMKTRPTQSNQKSRKGANLQDPVVSGETSALNTCTSTVLLETGTIDSGLSLDASYLAQSAVDLASNSIGNGRKRKRNEDKWKKNVRKVLRNSGKAYISQKGGVIVSEKKFVEDFTCGCRRNCKDNVSSEVRKQLFESFWKLGDWTKQNIYLKGLVQVKATARSRPRDGTGSKKHCSNHYFLNSKDASVEVCKKMFLATFCINWGRLFRCLKKADISSVADKRGKNISTRKIDCSDVAMHIDSFPRYKSHTSKHQNANGKYLHSNLNVRKMYDLYVEKCNSESKIPVKLTFYYRIFNEKFNLRFQHPK